VGPRAALEVSPAGNRTHDQLGNFAKGHIKKLPLVCPNMYAIYECFVKNASKNGMKVYSKGLNSMDTGLSLVFYTQVAVMLI
jgi:hypothetical protein